jgi:hypothetical protein
LRNRFIERFTTASLLGYPISLPRRFLSITQTIRENENSTFKNIGLKWKYNTKKTPEMPRALRSFIERYSPPKALMVNLSLDKTATTKGLPFTLSPYAAFCRRFLPGATDYWGTAKSTPMSIRNTSNSSTASSIPGREAVSLHDPGNSKGDAGCFPWLGFTFPFRAAPRVTVIGSRCRKAA